MSVQPYNIQGVTFSLSFFIFDKNKTAEIEKLKAQLKEREDASKKMVDQMEELHENLAELDSRFERSEEHNQQLRDERTEFRDEHEQKTKAMKSDLVSIISFFYTSSVRLRKISPSFVLLFVFF